MVDAAVMNPYGEIMQERAASKSMMCAQVSFGLDKFHARAGDADYAVPGDDHQQPHTTDEVANHQKLLLEIDGADHRGQLRLVPAT